MAQDQKSRFCCIHEPLSEYPKLTGRATFVAQESRPAQGTQEAVYFTYFEGENGHYYCRESILESDLPKLVSELGEAYSRAGIDFETRGCP